MDALTITRKILQGRGKAALRIGFPCDVYRPSAVANPLAKRVTTIKAAFNAADNAYLKPNLYGKPVWFGDFDGRITQVGDYLVRQYDGATFFIGAQQPLLPLVCIGCSRYLFVSRQAAAAAQGVAGYSGLNDLTDILGNVDTPWPASILMGGRRQSSTTGIPSGVSEAAWSILLPPSVPITILASDQLTDDLGRRFATESAELSDLGWRILASEVHT